MLTTYRRVLGRPGAARMSGSALVARLPISMVSLGLVLLVSSRTGSYTLAGTVSATYLLANAACAVPQARLVDRLGQRRVLPVAVGLFALGLAGVMLCVERGLLTPWPHLSAVVAGAAMPQIGSCVRARWTLLLPDKSQLQTAFAVEAVADETVFIVGQALVTVLATAVHPLAGLSAAVLATLVGTTALVAQRSTEPPPRGRAGADPAGAGMPWRLLGPLVVSAFAMGALLGGAEVSAVAFADEHGRTGLAGVVLAVWAAGSLLAGIVVGALPTTAPHPVRFRWGMLAFALLVLPLPFAGGFVTLALFMFASGFAVSPTLIAAVAWIEESVPPDRITEGITVFTTGLGAGVAPGAALAGRVVDTAGASPSFWVAVVAAGFAAASAFGAVRLARLSPASPSPSRSSG